MEKEQTVGLKAWLFAPTLKGIDCIALGAAAYNLYCGDVAEAALTLSKGMAMGVVFRASGVRRVNWGLSPLWVGQKLLEATGMAPDDVDEYTIGAFDFGASAAPSSAGK